MFSSSGGEEQSQKSTGFTARLRFDKQTGDFHGNQERKEHASALEFAMQAVGWRGYPAALPPTAGSGKPSGRISAWSWCISRPWRLPWLTPSPPTPPPHPSQREVYSLGKGGIDEAPKCGGVTLGLRRDRARLGIHLDLPAEEPQRLKITESPLSLD